MQACSESMHECGLGPLRANHGDKGLITTVGKAALKSLGNLWPDAQRIPQSCWEPRADFKWRKRRSGRKRRPARLGTWATSDSPLCLSKLYRKDGKRECSWAREGHRHTTLHHPPTGHTCARGSKHVISFNPLNSPRRSTIPHLFQTRKLRG